MATISDTLETIFRFSGAQAGIAQFEALTAGAASLATAEAGATAATTGLSGALAALGGPVTLLVGALAALGVALTGGALKSLDEFADSQQNLFRTTVLFQNLGSSLPISELQALASEIQNLTGFDDDLIISLGGVLARFGIAGQEIPAAVHAIADAAAATGQTVDELGLTFGRALLGNTRGLRNLGIEFKATGDRAADAARLVELFNERFEGAGAGGRSLLGRTFEAFQNSLANLFESIGRVLAPTLITVLNQIITLMDRVRELLDGLADRFPSIFPSGADIAARLKIKGDPEQTRLLGDIAENTKAIPDKLIQTILGGPGTVANRAGNLRDARIAWGV